MVYQYILSGEQSKFVDSYCIHNIGIPSVVLMERAALCVVKRLEQLHQEKDKYLIICGVGNNGADGLAVARLLDNQNYPVAVKVAGDIQKATEEFRIQLNIIKKTDIFLEYYSEGDNIDTSFYTWIVDGILGTGLSRTVGGVYQSLIQQINESDCQVLSIDIPSGLHADTGYPMGIAVAANETVTFGNYKLGHKLGCGRDYCGNITLADIGFRKEAYAKLLQMNLPVRICSVNNSIKNLLPKRPQCSNKGTFGKATVIAGIGAMPGAAFFSASAAYKMGVGLVRVITAKENLQIIRTKLPEAITCGISESENWKSIFESVIPDSSALVIGPGFGTDIFAEELLMYILELYTEKQLKIPVVLDADALNIISKHSELLQHLNRQFVLTPHILEMARLCHVDKQILVQTPLHYAEDFANKYHCTCILKDATTIVACMDDGIKTYINLSGNSGMATGGSGDVLAGMIGGLLAQNTELSLFDTASLCVWLHGAVGDYAASRLTEYGVMASNLLEYLPDVLAMQ